jgi:hypothetical protein
MNLIARLERLETEISPARGFVILCGEGETSEQAIALAGINPAAHDLVVVVGRGGKISPDRPRLCNEFEVRP